MMLSAINVITKTTIHCKEIALDTSIEPCYLWGMQILIRGAIYKVIKFRVTSCQLTTCQAHHSSGRVGVSKHGNSINSFSWVIVRGWLALTISFGSLFTMNLVLFREPWVNCWNTSKFFVWKLMQRWIKVLMQHFNSGTIAQGNS